MFVPINQRSVVERVLEQVRALILDGQLAPNSCLPPETTLSKTCALAGKVSASAAHSNGEA